MKRYDGYVAEMCKRVTYYDSYRANDFTVPPLSLKTVSIRRREEACNRLAFAPFHQMTRQDP
jgi:hypothetical protein